MINNTKNGYADAYSESEAADYEAKGWARFVPAAAKPAEKLASDPLEKAWVKRGRPFKSIDQAA